MKSVALRNLFILLLVVNGWAFNVIAIKSGLTKLPPLFMLTLRFTLVAAVAAQPGAGCADGGGIFA